MNKPSYFHDFIKSNAANGKLVVQPRMGFSNIDQMRNGLQMVKQTSAPTIGTITLDSFTRVGNFRAAAKAIESNQSLNGYPIVSYSNEKNEALIKGIQDASFPVQVRHGSPLPNEIFKATIDASIDAIEGGPLSYCFPYGRTLLKDSIASWQTCSRLFAEVGGEHYHIESFGGCMMGQLCPPSLLIAITIMEAMFFKSYGVTSYSLSLAQGTNAAQDIAALKVLRHLGSRYLGNDEAWHIVFYNFMGKFPQTYLGARAIIEEGARIAKVGGAERLIVKTVKEAHQIPLIEDNINALHWTYDASKNIPHNWEAMTHDIEMLTEQVMEEANCLLEVLLNLDATIDKALLMAFDKGYWDVPYCLHPNNNRKTLARINKEGLITWAETGNIPFTKNILQNNVGKKIKPHSSELYKMLSYNKIKYDSLSHDKYYETSAVSDFENN